jgi:Fur family ferric uptake transcriptional regulator
MNEVVADQFEKTLKLAGYSVTWPRTLVFGALQHEEPLTMAELVARCTNIDRASVYRTVDLFEHLGIVQRLQLGWKYKLELSDVFHTHHHHLHCTSCDTTIALPADTSLEQKLKKTAQNFGFRLDSHQLELSGVCAKCQQT